MSKILELYRDILENNHRFIDEIFKDDSYRGALPQLTIIDAGAYEGEFSFYCYNFAKIVYAFEPDPKPYAILASRVRDFKLDKIQALPLALAATSGQRSFYASGGGGSMLRETTDSPESITVAAISLDDFIKDNNIDEIDILKIDIEDGEGEIFNSPDFPKIAKKIKLIIGEHLAASKDALLANGFTLDEEVHSSNQVFRRK